MELTKEIEHFLFNSFDLNAGKAGKKKLAEKFKKIEEFIADDELKIISNNMKIENLVKSEITSILKDKDNVQKYITNFYVQKQKRILSNLSKIEINSNFIRSILAKVVLFKEKVEIVICKNQLVKALESIITDDIIFTEAKAETDEPIKIIKNIRIATTSRNGSVLIVNGQKRESNITPALVKIVVKSYYWNKLILEGKAKDNRDIQKLENLNDNDYIKKALNLRIISPRIVEAIINGTQPADLTVQKLLQVKTLGRKEQEKQLNFA